jgi:hypothetical protein
MHERNQGPSCLSKSIYGCSASERRQIGGRRSFDRHQFTVAPAQRPVVVLCSNNNDAELPTTVSYPSDR